MTITPQEIAQRQLAIALMEVLPHLQSELDQLKVALTNKVSADISKGTLTPEKAMAYWHEYDAFKRFATRLTAKATISQTGD